MRTVSAVAVTLLPVAVVAGMVFGTDRGDWPVPPTRTVTVDGRDYPVCAVEDCSDQPGQVGVWFDRSGAAWLSLGEYSVPVQP